MDSLLLEYDENYYAIDRKLGLSVLVNGESVYMSCNADLIDYTVSPPDVNKSLYKFVGKHNYRPISFSLGDTKLVLKFYIGGSTQESAQKNVNKLLSYFVNKLPIVKIGDTKFEYVCSIQGSTSKYTKVKSYYEVELTCDAVKRLPLVTYEYTSQSQLLSQKFIDYKGSLDSGVNMLVVLLSDYPYTFVNFGVETPYGDVSYRLQVEGSYRVFNVDGINGKILAANTLDTLLNGNGTNWFSKSNVIDFPVLRHGINNITLDRSHTYYTASLTVSYYPLFML